MAADYATWVVERSGSGRANCGAVSEPEHVDRPGAVADLAEAVLDRSLTRCHGHDVRPSSGSSPSARRAASALECVQPEPWAAPSGWRGPVSVSSVVPS